MQWNVDSPRLGLNGDSVGAEKDREKESKQYELYSGNILNVQVLPDVCLRRRQ